MLQCRPLTQTAEGGSVRLPLPEERGDTLSETVGVSMGFSRSFGVDVIVYIDAVAYYRMPYADKYRIRDALSAVNWHFRGQDKRMVLITPGRIGTSSPELGVPSSFADISEFNTVIEVSETEAGYVPELSYGSHFFQDLVEAGILYTAVFRDGTTLAFSPEAILGAGRSFTEYSADERLSGIFHVMETSGCGVSLYYDMISGHFLIAADKKGG